MLLKVLQVVLPLTDMTEAPLPGRAPGDQFGDYQVEDEVQNERFLSYEGYFLYEGHSKKQVAICVHN